MKFSIILNSRKRVGLLYSLLASIHNNTANRGDIEVLVSCDNDDEDTVYHVNVDFGTNGSLKSQFPFADFEFIERNTHLNNRLTSLALQARGKYILILNDDTEILTPNWDRIAWESMETVSDEIVYGYTHCNSADKEYHAQYASFPIVSRKSVDILGYFMHPAFSSLGGDVHLWRIYDELNRVVDVPIQIRHTLHETIEKVIRPDETAFEMRSRAGRMDWWTYPINEDVEKLRKYISG